MGSTLCCHLVHIIFSTKNREPHITPTIAVRLHAYLGSIARNRGCSAVAVGGIEDHVHLLIAVHPSIALADLVRDLKSNSSKCMHEDAGIAEFGWQKGYAAFSVSHSAADRVINYINTQREHHSTKDFRKELLAFLEMHKVAYDDRYVFT
ncbi:MAG: IS200/IS605 family transposase [Phycisphaerales bacterium]